MAGWGGYMKQVVVNVSRIPGLRTKASWWKFKFVDLRFGVRVVKQGRPWHQSWPPCTRPIHPQ
eukprot:2726795-Amphidinium_carterae.1